MSTVEEEVEQVLTNKVQVPVTMAVEVNKTNRRRVSAEAKPKFDSKYDSKFGDSSKFGESSKFGDSNSSVASIPTTPHSHSHNHSYYKSDMSYKSDNASVARMNNVKPPAPASSGSSKSLFFSKLNTTPIWKLDPQESFSDWTLMVRKKNSADHNVNTYHVHRAVLAAGCRKSLYFENLFRRSVGQDMSAYGDDKVTDNSCEISFTEEVANEVPTLLNYLYGSEDQYFLQPDNAGPLYDLADYFQIPPLIENVWKFLRIEYEFSETIPPRLIEVLAKYYSDASQIADPEVSEPAKLMCAQNLHQMDVKARNSLAPDLFAQVVSNTCCDREATLDKVETYIGERINELGNDFFEILLAVAEGYSEMSLCLLKSALVRFDLKKVDSPIVAKYKELSIVSLTDKILHQTGHDVARELEILPDSTQVELYRRLLTVASSRLQDYKRLTMHDLDSSRPEERKKIKVFLGEDSNYYLAEQPYGELYYREEA